MSCPTAVEKASSHNQSWASFASQKSILTSGINLSFYSTSSCPKDKLQCAVCIAEQATELLTVLHLIKTE